MNTRRHVLLPVIFVLALTAFLCVVASFVAYLCERAARQPGAVGETSFMEDDQESTPGDPVESLEEPGQGSLEGTEQPSVEETGVGDFLDQPGDCLPGESYDAEDHVCRIALECGRAEACQEEVDALLALLFELTEDLLSEEMEEPGDWVGGSEHPFVIYRVDGNWIGDPDLRSASGDMLIYQNDTETHQEIWSYVVRLIPQEQRTSVSGFSLFTDGPEELLAAVEPDYGDPSLWYLSIDMLDAQPLVDLTASLIHEFGHLLTLNAGQVPPDTELFFNPEDDELYYAAVLDCPQYFTGEGCSLPDSYINVFFNRFWIDLYDEWLDIDAIVDDDEYYAALDDLYYAHQDWFVTDYAVTDPGEDIAESFLYFILSAKPDGETIAEAKILFFYEFPELIELRAEIVARLYAYLRRP